MGDKYLDTIKKIAELVQEEKIQEAVDEFDKIPIEQMTDLDLLLYGTLSFEVKNYSRVIDIFENKVDKRVRVTEILRIMARSYEELGKIDMANKYYQDALATGEEYPEIYFDYAYALDEQGNIEEAIKYYKKTIEIEPKSFWAYVNLGSIYEKQDKDIDAIEYFLKAYELDKTSSMVNFNLGVSYVKLKQYDKGLEHYLLELKTDKPYPYTYYNLGLLYKNYFNDFTKARLYYLKSIDSVGKLLKDNKDLEKLYYSSWYNLGCLYAIYNDYANANDCFKYIYYKKKKYLDYIYDDEELKDYRNSESFKELDILLGGNDEK
ncbi:MAG: tetratricopeptide repeat protein [Bacilli bacterium]|nr:tetratricopeptide repeat protein [Bacilli bacterium]